MNQNKSGKMYFNTCLAESGPSYWEISVKQIQNARTGSLDKGPECARKSAYSLVTPLLPGVSARGMEKHCLLPQTLLECGNCSGLRKKESLFLKPVAIPSKRASCSKWSFPPQQKALRAELQQQIWGHPRPGCGCSRRALLLPAPHGSGARGGSSLWDTLPQTWEATAKTFHEKPRLNHFTRSHG